MTHMTGNEETDRRSGRRRDLLAAAFIAALSVTAMVLALRLPNPGSSLTHPGFLPFLTGLSLLAMAAGLAISALRGVSAKSLLCKEMHVSPGLLESKESRRTLTLLMIIAIYVLLTDLITFDVRYPTRFFVVWFGSFEAVSIAVLMVTLRLFWRASLRRCFLVSVLFVIALASVFRYGFNILLPGAN